MAKGYFFYFPDCSFYTFRDKTKLSLLHLSCARVIIDHLLMHIIGASNCPLHQLHVTTIPHHLHLCFHPSTSPPQSQQARPVRSSHPHD